MKEYLKWIFNYKKINKELSEETHQNDVERVRLQNEISEREDLIKEREKLIQLKEKHISELENKIRDMKVLIAKLEKSNNKLNADYEIKEQERRRLAGRIGGYVTQINKLNNELNLSNQKLEYALTRRRAPSREEIVAYERNQKEVLKRSKESKDNARNN